MNRVFVTGASGFVGATIVRQLVAGGMGVNALVHKRPLLGYPDSVISIPGGLFDPAALQTGMRDCRAVIHVVGIIMENRGNESTFERIHFGGTKGVVDAARQAGVRRYVQMSALGTRADAATAYHQSKFKAEEYVRASGLDWTIFRPSLIHGPGGEFIQMEARWARRKSPPFLFMPYFGSGLLGTGGAGKLQPVYVQDIARAFVEAIDKPQTIGKTYDLAGPEVITWPQLHRAAARAFVGKTRAVLPIPAWLGLFYAKIGIARLLGFNRDQVVMSQEDNTADNSKFQQDFPWPLQPFESTLNSYAALPPVAASHV